MELQNTIRSIQITPHKETSIVFHTNFAIKQSFISSNKFQQLTLISRRSTIVYDSICWYLEKYYLSFKTLYDNLYQKLEPTMGHHLSKNIYLKEFRSFLFNFITVLKNTCIFQVDCLTEIRASIKNDQGLQRQTKKLIIQVKKFKPHQDSLKQKALNIQILAQQINSDYSSLKLQSKKPISFYDKKLMKEKICNIKQKISKLKENKQILEKEIVVNTDQSKQLQSYLIAYRKELFLNKYRYWKKIQEMSKSSRQSLTQILILLFECVNKRKKQFQLLKTSLKKNSVKRQKGKTSTKSPKHQKNDDLAIQIINLTQQYLLEIQQLSIILYTLSETLHQIGNRCLQAHQKVNDGFFQELSKIYQNQQNPCVFLIQTLDIFQYFSKKITQVSEKLIFCHEDLFKLKKNIKKHSQLTLSLIKCSPYKSKVIDIKSTQMREGEIQTNKNYTHLDQLKQQMSSDYVNAILDRVYQQFYETLNQLKQYFNQKYYKKRKQHCNDSLQISHIEQQVNIIHKRPAKNQIWLWGQWKDTTISAHNSDELIENIQQFLKQIDYDINSGKQIESYPCRMIYKKQIKGNLKLMENELEFQSTDPTAINLKLNIPYCQIQQISCQVSLLQKIMVLYLPHKMQISFKKFMHNIDQVQQKIENLIQQLNEKIQENNKQIIREIYILTQQEQQKMQAWKKKVKSQTANIDDYQKVQVTDLPDVKINEYFDIIHSNKPVKIKGKQYPSFFQYTLEKLGNFNAKVKCLFQPPGPKFYLQNSSVTFQNSPIYSRSIFQYDHPIPPIPFMPKHTKCKTTLDYYWISNKQFAVQSLIEAFGAPYTENFVVRNKHEVEYFPNENKTQIRSYLKFDLKKQFSMQSFIKNKTITQALESMRLCLNQQKKYVMLKKKKSHQKGGQNLNANANDNQKQDEEKYQQADEKQQQINNLKKNVDSLKNKNQILIGIVIFLILINIIMNIFF